MRVVPLVHCQGECNIATAVMHHHYNLTSEKQI